MASGVERQNGVQLSAFSFEIAPSVIRPLSSDVRPISAFSTSISAFRFQLSAFDVACRTHPNGDEHQTL